MSFDSTVVFKGIQGISNLYKAGDDGNVYSFYKGNPRRLKPSPNESGYFSVSVVLSCGRRISRDVHKLVCRAFHGEQPQDGRMTVAHKDGDNSNNVPTNLMWKTYRGNLSHKYFHETHDNGTRNSRASLCKDKLFVCRYLLANTSLTLQAIADMLEVKVNVVTKVNNNTRYTNMEVSVVENTLLIKKKEAEDNGAI